MPHRRCGVVDTLRKHSTQRPGSQRHHQCSSSGGRWSVSSSFQQQDLAGYEDRSRRRAATVRELVARCDRKPEGSILELDRAVNGHSEDTTRHH